MGWSTEADAGEQIVAARQNHARSAVTVAVTLYNYRDYVAPCLDSVSLQTLSHVDLVVVDDCSTDDGGSEVSRWLRAHGDRFGRYTCLRHSQNRGLAAARNTAFTRAETPYVFVLDVDNVLYPRCLQRLVISLETCAASFAYCYLEKFGAEPGLHNMKSWDPTTLQHNNTIDAMVLLRHSVWEAIGGYSTDMPVMGWEDFDLWFKIARIQGWGVQVPEILARYRVHHDSMIQTVTNPKAADLWRHLRAKYPEFFTHRGN